MDSIPLCIWYAAYLKNAIIHHLNWNSIGVNLIDIDDLNKVKLSFCHPWLFLWPIRDQDLTQLLDSRLDILPV